VNSETATPRVNGAAALEGSGLFRFVPEGERERLLKLFKREQYSFGDLIVKQGEPADAFFVIAAGRARVIRHAEDGQELSLKLLREGDEFGESALREGGVRTATVRCSSSVEVLRLDRADFLKLLEAYPQFKEYIDLTSHWRTLHSFLYEFSNFGRLPAGAMQSLMQKLQMEEAKRGKILFRQGDPPGPMYIIERGHIRIFTGNNGDIKNISFLREGEFFGELAVLNGAPRAASVEAVTDCKLLALSPEAVREICRQFPEFNRLLEERRAQYKADQEVRVPLDFLVEALPAEAEAANKTAVDDENLPSEPQTGPVKDGERSPSIKADGAQPFEQPDGLFRKRSGRIRRFPFIEQIDEMDCGAASLAMICRHFGKKISLARIRQLCHTAYDGTSLKALSHAASELGLASRALKVSMRNLSMMPLPAIVHWEGNHWMVLYNVAKDFVQVADPAIGLRRIARKEFEQKWSGYAALFDYTTAFDQAPEGRSSLAWMLPFVTRHRLSLLQAMGLAGIAVILQLLLPIFTQVIVDKVIVEQDFKLLQVVIAAMLVSGVFLLAANLIQQYLLSFIAVRIDTGVLDFLMRQLLALPMSYFHSRRTGDIQRRLDGAQQIRQFMIEHGIGALLAFVQAAGCLALMAAYNIVLMGAFLAVLPLYLGLMYFSVKVLRPVFAELEEGYGKYSSHQIDAIKGIEAVKAAAAETSFRDAMLNEFVSISKKMFRSNFIAMSYESAIQMVGLLSTVLFLLLGASMVIKGQISVGSFVAFNTLLAMAYTAVLRVLSVWDQLQREIVLLDRLNDIFEQEPEQGRDRSRLKPVPSLEGHVELRNIGFRYGGPESPSILQGITLEIGAGRNIAIVGRSGCGKTTLIKLIAGLIEPTEGSIYFDHLDLKSLNYRDVRRKIGIVLQENHLFSDTILRNISFGDPEPDFDKVLWAAQLANAHEFVMRLPLGYETKVGETGLAVSGGQKQRICIARAIYNNPPILIFDEATSALDTESERAIQENMTRLLSGRTSIIIAHRLSTIRNADMIIVLEKGKLAEIGSHDELMAKRGLYFYLSSQQMGV
jgi:HlyB family type I secretion system ABC transporter